MADKNRIFIFKEETALRDILFIPLFLSLYLVYHFFKDTGFHLESFTGRPISVATSEAIDIGKRVGSFYNGFGVFVLLALSFTYLIFKVRQFLLSDDLHLLNASSAAGICLLFFQLFGAEMSPSLHLVIAIQLVIFLGIILKSRWKFHNDENIYSALFVWVISLSFSLYFLQVQLFQLAGISGGQSLPVFLCIFSSVLLLYYFLLQRTQAFNSSIVHANIFTTVPLAFLPLLSVMATEFYMILNQHNIHSPGIKFIYFVLLFLILAWMAYRNIKWRRSAKTEQVDLLQILSRTWFPILCTGVAALAFYKPIVSVSVDWFEDANRILPLQQWFDFGKLPFLDTFSSHAFSDFGPGVLFSVLNGYNPLGGFVYQFLVPVLVTLVIYLFVFRITQNGLIAIFLALFYPYSDFILPSYYNLIPVTILALLNIYRKQSVTNYSAFFTVLVLMIFWRIDLGSANLVAGIGGLLILCAAVPGFKADYRQLLKGFLLVSVGTLAVFLIAVLFYEGNIFKRISEAVGYMSSFQSYGLKDLSGVKDIKYYFLYFILPIAVFLSAAHALLKLVRNKDQQQSITSLALSILFLSIFFFTNFQRGLVRHTLAEQWDTALTSYGFFILAAGVFFNARFRNNKAISFFLFISISTLVVINYKFSSPDLTKNNIYFVAKQQMQLQVFIPPSHAKINRVTEAADIAENYNELNAFLKNNFPDSSTFLDFSNSPMLYHYLGRITPNYFCQIPHTAHNDKMQRDLLDGLKKYNIPVVIFSNVPVTFWDYLDGIPNTLRHYRISEYIYSNYKPYAILSRHSVWIRKDVDLKEFGTNHLVDLKNLS